MTSRPAERQDQLEAAIAALRLSVTDARRLTAGRRARRWVVLRIQVVDGRLTPGWLLEQAHLGGDVLELTRGVD